MGYRDDDTAIATLLPGPLGDAAAALQPEKRLMLAVLEGAVSDFQKYATASTGRGRRLFAEADAWIASGSTDRPLDFENICHALALEPSAIRVRLRTWWMARQAAPAAGAAFVHVPARRTSGSRHQVVATS